MLLGAALTAPVVLLLLALAMERIQIVLDAAGEPGRPTSVPESPAPPALTLAPEWYDVEPLSA